MYQKYRGVILFVCITIIVTIILYIVLSVASNSIRRNKFAEEAKIILSAAQNESISTDKSYFDSNSNKLRDYRGQFNYFFKLDDVNSITYLLIYNNDYVLELNSQELIDIETINKENKHIYDITKNKLAEKVKNIHDELSKKFIDYELEKENIKKYNEELEKQKKEIEKNAAKNNTNNTSKNSTNNNNSSSEITYKIEKDYYQEKSMSAGYKGEWLNNRFMVTIYLGYHTRGGYSIEIKEVKASGNDVTIVIKTSQPSAGDNTTTAIDYPTARISFNKEPSSYKVVYENGTVFEANQTDNKKFGIKEN